MKKLLSTGLVLASLVAPMGTMGCFAEETETVATQTMTTEQIAESATDLDAQLTQVNPTEEKILEKASEKAKVDVAKKAIQVQTGFEVGRIIGMVTTPIASAASALFTLDGLGIAEDAPVLKAVVIGASGLLGLGVNELTYKIFSGLNKLLGYKLPMKFFDKAEKILT